MKKIFLLLILGINLGIITSCSDDDDNTSAINGDFSELIVGEWERTSFTINGENLTLGCSINLKVSFDADGSYGESPLNDTCTATGNTGTYTLEGNVLNIMSGFFAKTVEITAFTENTFTYSYFDEDGDFREQSYSRL